jgi:carbonic anhydrase
MSHLGTHPSVASHLALGELRIFGWYYDIGAGEVLQYDQSLGRFQPVNGAAHEVQPGPLLAAAS